ncbi:MAG: hypothetical protein EOP47_26850 [Sphingobacteriaceae bacterium]|nr:MAG: hypothetical protein EOP47_26850 [Sphingobacteriaceae bacterium]
MKILKPMLLALLLVTSVASFAANTVKTTKTNTPYYNLATLTHDGITFKGYLPFVSNYIIHIHQKIIQVIPPSYPPPTPQQYRYLMYITIHADNSGPVTVPGDFSVSLSSVHTIINYPFSTGFSIQSGQSKGDDTDFYSTSNTDPLNFPAITSYSQSAYSYGGVNIIPDQSGYYGY